jgi:hypothetical protein
VEPKISLLFLKTKLEICSHEEGKRGKIFTRNPRLVLDSRARNEDEFSLLISSEFESTTRP